MIDLSPTPTYYSNTWHETREGALKCPVCKPKVLAGQETDKFLDEYRGMARRMMSGLASESWQP